VSRPVLYLSGPYSATEDNSVTDNIAVARQFAVKAWEKGWAALCPHLNTAHFEGDCDLDHADWLDGDLGFIERLDPERDAMLMLPGWVGSAGSMQERSVAIARRIRVFYAHPLDAVDAVPAAPRIPQDCEHYRRVHYESTSCDVCAAPVTVCPPGVSCPIQRRVHPPKQAVRPIEPQSFGAAPGVSQREML
jgi:hypothetical protein